MLNSFNSYKTSKKSTAAMMDYTSLEAATGKFSESSVLGVGGFGCVYRANFDGGVAAAVKRLGGGAQNCEKEFEVIAYSNLYLYRQIVRALEKILIYFLLFELTE
jgi:hypothetical protein